MIPSIASATGWPMFSQATEASMASTDIRQFADKKFLYLTTVGRRTGLPRQIEIWFVVYGERFYLFAETGEAAAWVKNIRRNPEVVVRVGEWQLDATARVLDRQADRNLWDQLAVMANHKYGWGEGLPVEITPLPRALRHASPNHASAPVAERRSCQHSARNIAED